jgi:hypothetical protein
MMLMVLLYTLRPDLFIISEKERLKGVDLSIRPLFKGELEFVFWILLLELNKRPSPAGPLHTTDTFTSSIIPLK